MKDYEVYSSLRVPKNSKIIVRLDGRAFHKLARDLDLTKPYDEEFYQGISALEQHHTKYYCSVIRPNIEIKSNNFFLEINFHMKWIDREKKENIDYFRNFLGKKIIGEFTKGKVNKIEFLEDINLNEEKYEEFFFDELYEFPKALFNIQSNYFDDYNYWSQIDRFFKLKFIVNEIIKKIDDNYNRDNNQNNIEINTQNNIHNNKDLKENIIIDESVEEYENKINHLNKNILSIRDLNHFILDFRKNKISIASDFFNTYKTNEKNLKNKIPSKLTLINFTYDKNKDYFNELNNKVNILNIIQRIYKNTPYPFNISPKF